MAGLLLLVFALLAGSVPAAPRRRRTVLVAVRSTSISLIRVLSKYRIISWPASWSWRPSTAGSVSLAATAFPITLTRSG